MTVNVRKRSAGCQSGSKCSEQVSGCQLINVAASQEQEKSRLLVPSWKTFQSPVWSLCTCGHELSVSFTIQEGFTGIMGHSLDAVEGVPHQTFSPLSSI